MCDGDVCWKGWCAALREVAESGRACRMGPVGGCHGMLAAVEMDCVYCGWYFMMEAKAEESSDVCTDSGCR